MPSDSGSTASGVRVHRSERALAKGAPPRDCGPACLEMAERKVGDHEIGIEIQRALERLTASERVVFLEMTPREFDARPRACPRPARDRRPRALRLAFIRHRRALRRVVRWRNEERSRLRFKPAAPPLLVAALPCGRHDPGTPRAELTEHFPRTSVALTISGRRPRRSAETRHHLAHCSPEKYISTLRLEDQVHRVHVIRERRMDILDDDSTANVPSSAPTAAARTVPPASDENTRPASPPARRETTIVHTRPPPPCAEISG